MDCLLCTEEFLSVLRLTPEDFETDGESFLANLRSRRLLGKSVQKKVVPPKSLLSARKQFTQMQSSKLAPSLQFILTCQTYTSTVIVGHYEALLESMSLGSGQTSIFDSDGSAIVIHSTADDNMTDPAGNSGDRIACGVITKATAKKP